MKKHILEDFYRGDFVPASRPMKQSPEMNRAADELTNAEKQLRAMISPEAAALLERLKEAHDTLDSLTEESAYIDGFKAGAQFMLEILYDPGSEPTSEHKEDDHDS